MTKAKKLGPAWLAPAWLRRAWLRPALAALLSAACVGSVGESPDMAAPAGGGAQSGPGPRAPGVDPGSAPGAPPPVVPPPPVSACKLADAAAGAGLVRRLTHEEIRRSLEVALGTKVDPAMAALGAEVRAPKSFRNEASLLTAGAEWVASVEAFADRVSASADRVVARFAPCAAFGDACETQLVRELGLRLFRRPLTAEQITAFRGLFRAARDGGDGFVPGAALVLRAMVQAPQFLYRLEREASADGKPRALDDHELAARLSFLTWGSGPDDALLEAASAGRLRTREAYGRELARLLDDPRAQAPIATFATEWLELDHLADLALDTKRYPTFDAALKQEMVDETRRFFADLYASKRPLTEMLTARDSVPTERLAKLYGLPGVADGRARHDLSATPRIGFLTQAAYLAAHAGGDTPRIVDRGVTTFRDVLCQEPVAPPAGVDIGLGQRPIGPGVTERVNAETRAKNPTCGACHIQFDPLAFPFERFDAIGRYSERDPFGNELRSDGVLLDATGRMLPYRNAVEFAPLLARDDRFEACVVTKTLQFAWGRGLETGADPDACVAGEVRARANAGGGSLRALLLAIAEHDSFRLVAAR